MEPIRFETKSDRELLILVAEKTNAILGHLVTLNDSVARHSTDIGGIKLWMASNPCCESKSKRTILKDNWQLLTGIVALASGVLFALGKVCGWW